MPPPRQVALPGPASSVGRAWDGGVAFVVSLGEARLRSGRSRRLPVLSVTLGLIPELLLQIFIARLLLPPRHKRPQRRQLLLPLRLLLL